MKDNTSYAHTRTCEVFGSNTRNIEVSMSLSLTIPRVTTALCFILDYFPHMQLNKQNRPLDFVVKLHSLATLVPQTFTLD